MNWIFGIAIGIIVGYLLDCEATVEGVGA